MRIMHTAGALARSISRHTLCCTHVDLGTEPVEPGSPVTAVQCGSQVTAEVVGRCAGVLSVAVLALARAAGWDVDSGPDALCPAHRVRP